MLLQKVPHHNSMPASRRLGHRRTSAGGSLLRSMIYSFVTFNESIKTHLTEVTHVPYGDSLGDMREDTEKCEPGFQHD